MPIDLLVFIGLLLLNGFFALSEMAMVAARKSRLKNLAKTSRRAAIALELAEHPDRLLSTVQFGITLVGVFIGAYSGTALGHWLADHLAHWPWLAAYAEEIGIGTALFLITVISIMIGELIPKRLALVAPERIATAVAVPMALLARLASPVVGVLSWMTQRVMHLLGFGKRAGTHVTEEEIRLLVAEGAEQGVIDDAERGMVNRVLKLGERSAASLMTPRTKIVWLDAEAPLADNLAVMRATPYSRYPVMRGSDREVLGVVEVKSLLAHLGQERGFDLFAHLEKPLYVPENTPALNVLDSLREHQAALALVVDEYGDLLGMVTLTDVLSAVIGYVASSGDGNPAVVERDDGSLLLDGSLSLEELRELLGTDELPLPADADFHTLAGLVMAHFGRIPKVGEHFEWRRWRFEVVDLDGARIDKVLLNTLPPVAEEPAA